MKTNTGLLALGLFTLAGVVTISCGGSSDDSSSSGNTSGSTSTAGTSTSGGGTTSTAGTSTTGAGTSSTAAGTSTTAGTSNGGTSSTGGTSTGGNATGGTGGRTNNGGFQNAGGDNAGPTCPATQPPADTACMRGDGGFLGCTYGDQTCRCQRGQNNMRTWVCQATQNPGAGGDNGGFGDATCPDNAKNGDTCTNGPGLCTGQQCFCNNQGMVQCF